MVWSENIVLSRAILNRLSPIYYIHIHSTRSQCFAEQKPQSDFQSVCLFSGYGSDKDNSER